MFFFPGNKYNTRSASEQHSSANSNANYCVNKWQHTNFSFYINYVENKDMKSFSRSIGEKLFMDMLMHVDDIVIVN